MQDDQKKDGGEIPLNMEQALMVYTLWLMMMMMLMMIVMTYYNPHHSP